MKLYSDIDLRTKSFKTKDNEIDLNSGETGAGVTDGYAGIRIERGSEPDYIVRFDETDDKLKVGPDGDLKEVALADDAMMAVIAFS